MGKKIFMVLLTVVFTFSIYNKAYAAELVSNGENVSVPVTYTVENTAFIITVPTVLNPQKTKSYFEITSSKMNLRPDEYIEVFIRQGCDERGKIVLTRQNDTTGTPATIETSVSIAGGSIIKNNYRVGYFKDGSECTKNQDGKVTLGALNVTENTKAGDYLGTVTFEVELKKNA